MLVRRGASLSSSKEWRSRGTDDKNKSVCLLSRHVGQHSNEMLHWRNVPWTSSRARSRLSPEVCQNRPAPRSAAPAHTDLPRHAHGECSPVQLSMPSTRALREQAAYCCGHAPRTGELHSVSRLFMRRVRHGQVLPSGGCTCRTSTQHSNSPYGSPGTSHRT